MNKAKKKSATKRGTKTIILDISRANYPRFIEDLAYAKAVIDAWIRKDKPAKIFPKGIVEGGYIFKGFDRVSQKQGLKKRRIQIGGSIYRIHPAFIASYMRAELKEVKWGIFLMRFGVPFWALALVLGKYAMFWYRLWIDLGKNSIIGTTIYSKADLPQHILNDEEHTYVKGKKAYIATTVAKGCLLGVEVVWKASENVLCKAYQVAADEVANIHPLHRIITSNTDGWSATQNALKIIYKGIEIVQCYLHGFIKVRHRKTNHRLDEFNAASDKIWDAYQAKTPASFAQRIRRLKEWAIKTMDTSPMKDNVLDLCKKGALWKVFYKYPQAHRTSNMLDRLMKLMKRCIKNAQFFHASTRQATLYMRAFALVYNFSPSNPWTIKKHKGLVCPADRINKFSYSDDWCINLMVATSLRGYRC